MNCEELEKIILASALENAVKHEGRALISPVISKLISIKPEVRDRVRSLIPLIKEVVEKVNSMSLEEQKKLYEEHLKYLPSIVKRPVERGGLPPLPKAVKGGVVTRFSPNPDFVLHLGSARAAILSHDYARMYDGKFILRFEDTDPRTKKPRREYYELIKEDLKWLGCEWDEEHCQSMRLDIYYRVAEELIERGKAYVCTCKSESFKALALSGKPCPCREKRIETHLDRFKSMLNGGFGEGEAVVRIKTSLTHPNPSIRDWPALRIIDTVKHPHPLTGSRFRVWPLYNFSCAVDDHYMNITHVIRGVEHRVNEERQEYIYRYMGWGKPVMIHHGKLGVSEGVLSKSKILSGLRSGLFKGYDDPRIATLISLRRRGFQPEAIRRAVYEVGLKPSTAIIEWRNLEAYNRQLIDSKANRRFIVLKPVKIRIKGLSEEYVVKLKLHPNFPERGKRAFKLKPVNREVLVYVEEDDLVELGWRGMVRLMGFANISLRRENNSILGEIVGFDVSRAREAQLKFIHWLPVNEAIESTILWSDASEVKCIGESGLLNEEVGSIVQLERIGYARVEDKSAKSVKLIFTHK